MDRMNCCRMRGLLKSSLVRKDQIMNRIKRDDYEGF